LPPIASAIERIVSFTATKDVATGAAAEVIVAAFPTKDIVAAMSEGGVIAGSASPAVSPWPAAEVSHRIVLSKTVPAQRVADMSYLRPADGSLELLRGFLRFPLRGVNQPDVLGRAILKS
jgi:hypothetical protein